MLRILFLFLWLIPVVLGSPARGEIEIYANGHKYDSLQAYQVSKESAVAHSSQESQNILSDATRHKLYVLSIENGMAGILQDFYETLDQSGPQMVHTLIPGTPVSLSNTPEQLQEAIQQAVTASKDPKLLISQPGKMRIMDLTPDNSK